MKNNLFYSLPIELQVKIIKMNPHPLHKIFMNIFGKEIICLNEHIRDKKEKYWFNNHKHAKLWSKTMDIYSGYYTYENNDSDEDDDSDDDTD